MAVNTDMNSTSSEPTSELASSSSPNSLPDCSSLVYLHEEDVPGVSLNGQEPSQLHVVELKCCLKCAKQLPQLGRSRTL